MRSVALDAEEMIDTLGVIRHHHRRFVLEDLEGRSPPVDLADLAVRLVESAPDPTAPGPTPDVEQAEIVLHHRHLPMLGDVGLLTYRPGETRVVDWPELDLPDDWRTDPSLGPLLAAMQSE